MHSFSLAQLAIILGCMAPGLGLGYTTGLARGNFGFVPREGVQFAMMFRLRGGNGVRGPEQVE